MIPVALAIFYLGFGLLVLALRVRNKTGVDTWPNFLEHLTLASLLLWPWRR